jgi:diguanylate cyclase (GGDEF)-like protein
MSIMKLKKAFEKANLAKKLKMSVVLSCIILVSVVFLINFSALMVLSAFAVDESAQDIGNLTIVLAIIAFLMTGGFTVLVILNVLKILRFGVSKPMFQLLYDIKKANEELEDLGISMEKDTEDEIVLIRSVYFDVAEQLKLHIDDVSKLSGLTAKFENFADYDALTGIYNRRRFMELVTKHSVLAAKKNEISFVAMLDLDFFKKVNDTYGHSAGDEVLRVVAARVKDTVRPYDLFGRYGGEEFIMFIAVNDVANALNLAERIRVIVEKKPIHFEGKDIAVTTSIGMAQVTADVVFDEALKLADEALYVAKEQGRNRVIIHGEDGGKS